MEHFRSVMQFGFCGLIALSCGCSEPYKEPTIKEFNGRLTHSGESVSFPEDEKVVLRLVFHKNGEHFGIPIRADGTFKIGWMPIGEFSGELERTGKKRSSQGLPVSKHQLPAGLEIAAGQTEYVIDLGDDFGS